MKLEINERMTIGKIMNLCILNNTLLRNQWIKEEITREIRKYLRDKWKQTKSNKTYDINKGCAKGEIPANTYIKKQKELTSTTELYYVKKKKDLDEEDKLIPKVAKGKKS